MAVAQNVHRGDPLQHPLQPTDPIVETNGLKKYTKFAQFFLTAHT